MGKLEGTVSVVTGASRGIGRHIALAQAEEGAKVAVIARGEDAMASVVADIEDAGGTAIAIAADLTDLSRVEAAFERVARDLGSVDTLINNAGVFFSIGPFWEVDPNTWWNDIEVNLKSAFFCSRAAIPGMIERDSGRIINLIGGGTAAPLPIGSAYSISKTGTMRLNECTAALLSGTGVKSFAIAPGLVRTDMTDYQLKSEAGRKYMQGIAKRFEEGDFLPPTRAAALTVEVASGRFDALNGRAISATEDLDTVEAAIEDTLKRDRRVLRLIGFGPTMKPID